MMITEKQKTLSVYGNYDTVVAGGGVAGISAALASARCGKKTLLLERMFMLGGLATAGLVTIYLPLCDGNGRQVSFGIAEELLRLSVKYGEEKAYDDKNQNYGNPWLKENSTKDEKIAQRFRVQFNANIFAILSERLLLENGVEILYGTTVCDTVTENDRISAIIIENKSGRQAICGKKFVDASGDADLCFMSGESVAASESGNTLASWYYTTEGEKYKLHMLGFAEGSKSYNLDPDKEKYKKRYSGLDGKENSMQMTETHKAILNNFLEKGNTKPDYNLSNIATIPQNRMTRRIVGAFTLDNTEFARYEDSIGMVSNWHRPGPVYEVPFSSLYGNKIKNLITAGRITSVTEKMWDIMRVIPCCAVTGEAAGTACSFEQDFCDIDVSELQKKLVENGVKLHIEDL